MDRLSPEQRRKAMQAVKCKDTVIELTLRKELWKRGLRYRKNYTKMFGRPDIVFTKQKVVVFCDSEFWHGYDWENRKDRIKTNNEYWKNKIEKNINRDKEVNAKLQSEGWVVLRFWGKDIKCNTSECIAVIKEASHEHIVREIDV